MAAKKNNFFQFSVINTHLKSKDYEFETHKLKICSLQNEFNTLEVNFLEKYQIFWLFLPQTAW